MTDHEQIEELLAADALGALEGEQVRQLEELRSAHGPECAECRVLEEGFGEVAGRLAFALKPLPAAVSAEYLLALTSAPARSLSSARGTLEGRRVGAGKRALAVAAAVVVLAGGIALGHSLPHRPTSEQAALAFLSNPETRLIPFQSSSGGRMALAMQPGGAGAWVIGSRIPAPPSGRVYQLWLIQGSTPVPGPTFVPSGGTVVLEVAVPSGGASAMAITAEPPGGSKLPSETPSYTAPISS